MADHTARIAVLIDSDNVSAEHVTNILAELTRYGTTSVRRMYGDWTSPRLGGWKAAANEHSIQPIQQFSYTTGKNATDSALIIDAMDLLHQNHLDAFAIVSSDSDFTRLAARLRESGARVFGFGEKKTPLPFVNACDTFTYLEALQVDAAAAGSDAPDQVGGASTAAAGTTRPTTNELRGDARLMNLLRAGIAASADDDGWANLGGVGSTIQRQAPDFDSRNWGYARLGDLIEAVGLFEVNRVKKTNGSTNLQVRDRRDKAR
ncbi:MAG: NYN domain-containing protein [Leucobacter sp.]|nr:NYN domain-containing protein [Leucobacter sp.]